MQALQVLGRRLACSYVNARQIRTLPVAAHQSARLLATRTHVPQATKKPAPAPVPEPEEEEDEFAEYEDDDPLAALNAAGKRRVQALKALQGKYDELHLAYQKDLALLQQKYADQYAPLFTERAEVVAGKKPVDKFDVEDDGEPDEGIPEFWLGALSNSRAGAFITERDAEVLRFLTDVRYEVLTGEDRGFKLLFTFADNNPHFTNKVLEKTYVLLPEDDVVPREFTGTKIDWKEGMDVTVEYQKKRVRPPKGADKNAKPQFVTEKVPTDSFFNIFDPPQVPNSQEAEAMSTEELEEVQTALGEDYDIGASIRERVVPRAVEWFTGERNVMDEEEFYDDEFEDENEY